MDLVEIAKRHRDADMLISGTYGAIVDDHWKGCSVGCFAREFGCTELENDQNIHAFVSEKTGVPIWAILLQDTIFENLPMPKSREWHVQIAEAYMKVSDWQLALHRVHETILKTAIRTSGETKYVVQRVLELHTKAAQGDEIHPSEWSAARSAAWSAARSAAWSAAGSAAWSAARSAECEELRDAILNVLPTPPKSS